MEISLIHNPRVTHYHKPETFSTSMARKRGGKSGPRRGDTRPRKQGHERRWNDRSDIPMDEIDECAFSQTSAYPTN